VETVKLISTRCAICQTEGNATELYPSNFDLEAFNPAVFSARRLPDRIHYRMVKCKTCGLVRSDPIADSQTLARLYAQSSFNYTSEIANLRLTYGHYLTTLLNDYYAKKGALLEIGCGNGFFLEEAIHQGYKFVQGVEPSIAAVEKASPQVRPLIICNVLQPGLFEAERFDVICMFQVLDHIPDPGFLLDECYRVLKPAGLMLSINHNVESVSAKFLKENSPIVDIEHTYLYSPATMFRIFDTHGFKVMHIDSVYNKYSAYYIIKLAPLLKVMKRMVLKLLKNSPLGRIHLSVRLGNLYLVAQKPY